MEEISYKDVYEKIEKSKTFLKMQHCLKMEIQKGNFMKANIKQNLNVFVMLPLLSPSEKFGNNASS